MPTNERIHPKLSYEQLQATRVSEADIGFNKFYGMYVRVAGQRRAIFLPTFISGIGQAETFGIDVHARFVDADQAVLAPNAESAIKGLHTARLTLNNGFTDLIRHIDGTEQELAVDKGFFVNYPREFSRLTPGELAVLELKDEA